MVTLLLVTLIIAIAYSVDPSGVATCGGFLGTQCQSGVCIDDPTDNCDPLNGGSDCMGICVEQCGGIAGIQCEQGYTCIDDPTDDCDPLNGGRDCGGICVQETTGTFCGGIAGIECEPGYSCVDDPTDNCDPAKGGSDCGGICVEDLPVPAFCGGIAGIQCDAGYTCIDDPRDDCDPARGGADCGGICVSETCPQTQQDFNANPAICNFLGPCAWGTETCCGETHDSFVCECMDGAPLCHYTDACLHPQCEACGGKAGIECEQGSKCVDDPTDNCDPAKGGSDCGGICVEDLPVPAFCGGIAGIQCDAGYTCIDDPRDDCDPARGGADCGGICVSETCPQTQQDFNANPEICNFLGPCAWGTETCCGETHDSFVCECMDGAPLCHYTDACLHPQCEACGGKAGIECEQGSKCVDDPTDNCDPANGGLDCGGFCESCNQVCIAIDAPVCCGGVTYPSLCNAEAVCLTADDCENVNGACPGDGDFCGGIAGIECGQGFVCIDDPTDDCDPLNGADCGGICRKQCGGFAGFPCPDEYECTDIPNDGCDPLNGGADCLGFCDPGVFCTDDVQECCDGTTVSRDPNNDCTFPLCPGCDGDFCGGIAAFQCAKGYKCIDDPEDDCDPAKGGSDCGGICAEDCTKICATIYQPVCCGGVTYGNLCSAEADCLSADECEDGECTVGCPKDAKLCCDGSSVSRDPDNNCEFPECPDCSCDIGGNECATGYECVDDCDPEQPVADRVADCPGICEPIETNICELSKEIGPCDAAIPRYYYNTETDVCEEFFYGGCDGNANNFETMVECQETCVDICALEVDPGTCKASFERYFYNSATGTCDTFTYGGCDGNANNFESEEDCEDACAETECTVEEHPFEYDIDPEDVENDICKFCFPGRSDKANPVCRRVAKVINGQVIGGIVDWQEYGWIINSIRDDVQCFLDYCKEQNSELGDDCELENVRVQRRDEFTEENCACDLFHCVEPLQSNIGRLEILIGIVMGLVTISWM